MKHFVILLISVGFGMFVRIPIADHALSALYTVSVIFFLIGMRMLALFDMNGIKNEFYLNEIRNNNKKLMNSFIISFLLSTCVYMIKSIETLNAPLMDYISTSNVSLLYFLFSITFFVVNIIGVKKLKGDIFDRLKKEHERAF